MILHGVFSLALKREWCADNPVSRVDVPALQAKPVVALTVDQCQSLVHMVRVKEKGEFLSAVGLMLYAGFDARHGK